jgi:hypothetical protein
VKTALWAVLIGATVGACAKHEPPPPAETSAPSASLAAAPASVASAAAPTPSASASAPSDPPTEEDFEDEASQKVTPNTLDAQLDALEKEIQSD